MAATSVIAAMRRPHFDRRNIDVVVTGHSGSAGAPKGKVDQRELPKRHFRLLTSEVVTRTLAANAIIFKLEA
jgi:hypothetical protein